MADPIIDGGTINVGDSIIWTATFRNGVVLYNPASVVAVAKRPSGEKATVALTHPSPGVFVAVVDGDYVGDWSIKIASTGAGEKKSIVGKWSVVSDGF